MPLYEYQCTACGKLTEKRQKFSDPEITECPHCGGKLERTITAPAVQFKGGGWYADLYSSGKKPASSAPDAGGGNSTTSEGTSSGGEKTSAGSTPAAAPASTPAASAPAATPSTPAK